MSARPAPAPASTASLWQPRWSRAVAGILAGVSCRHGGVSPSPFASLNLGFRVDDDAAHVRENRRRFARQAGFTLAHAIQPHLVHGTEVRVVDRRLAGHGAVDAEEPFAADGLVTATHGLPLLITTADCMSVFLAEPQGRAIALVHAGWRGLLDGVVQAAVRRLEQAMGVAAADLAVAVGPCIGPCCFEVEWPLARRFQGRFGEGVARPGKDAEHAWLDLPGALQEELQGLGVGDPLPRPPCTACEPARFFSHRGEGGRTGRMLAVAQLC